MLQPLTNNILIRPEKAPEQTESGLHLVEHWAPENMGEIIAIATQAATRCPSCDCPVAQPMSVKVGDTVIFPLEAGQELRLDGERLLLMKETDLLAVVEPHEVTNG
jgi:chaperonin GroES